MSEGGTAYPLCWPEGWPRTPIDKIGPSRFARAIRYASGSGYNGRFHSMKESALALFEELGRLGVHNFNAILSTNISTRSDGLPRSNEKQPIDRGAAVFFKLKGRDTHLACDRWNRVECNVWAIARHIEALRGQDRWGVGTIEQAFRGYQAIAERAGGIDPYAVLGLKVGASEPEILRAYKQLAKQAHPDVSGGSVEKFNELKLAADLLLARFKAQQ